MNVKALVSEKIKGKFDKDGGKARIGFHEWNLDVFWTVLENTGIKFEDILKQTIKEGLGIAIKIKTFAVLAPSESDPTRISLELPIAETDESPFWLFSFEEIIDREIENDFIEEDDAIRLRDKLREIADRLDQHHKWIRDHWTPDGPPGRQWG
jgi:hypothetical protein